MPSVLGMGGTIFWEDPGEEFSLGIHPKRLHTMVFMQMIYNAVIQHSRRFLKHMTISVFEKREIAVV